MPKKIISTLSAPMVFNIFEAAIDGIRKIKTAIHIGGGANVMPLDKKADAVPTFVETVVSDLALAELEKHDVFRRMVEKGFLTVADTLAKSSKVAKDLEKKDKAAPKTREDFKKSSADMQLDVKNG